MKNIKIIIVLIVVSAGVISCQKMEDIHAGYIKNGETIYAGKVYDPVALPGDGRIKVKLHFENGGSIRKNIIEWNDGANQLITDVTPALPLDSIEILINGLEEKSYIFNVYNVDKEGNRSIKIPVAGSVFGDLYRQSLNNRILYSMEGGGTVDSVVINWAAPMEGDTGVELSYRDSDGNETISTVPAENNRTVIRDWKSEGILKYLTKYIPAKDAIDTFRTSPSEIALPKFISFKGKMLAKDKWEIVNFSSDVAEGHVANVIDGNYDTYWHTQVVAPGYPHYFVIDLKETVKINKMIAFNRKGDDRGHTEFQLFTSTNGVDFVNQGTYDNDPHSASHSCQLDDLPIARYVKFVATQGPNTFTFLSELDIYGQIISD